MLQSCLNPRDSHAQPSCGSTRNHQLTRSCYESWMWDFISWLCEYHKLIKLIVCVTLCLFALKIPRVSLSSTACPLWPYASIWPGEALCQDGQHLLFEPLSPLRLPLLRGPNPHCPLAEIGLRRSQCMVNKNPQSVKFMICVLGTCVLGHIMLLFCWICWMSCLAGIHGRLSQRLSVRVRQKFCCQAIEKCWLRSCNY